MPPPIEVDDHFMGQVETTLRTMGEDIVASPHGPLANYTVQAGGPNFALGVAIVERVKAMTSEIDKNLSLLSTIAQNRAGQISMYRVMTDDTETLNDTSATDFLHDVPNWGQPTGGPATTT